VLLFVGIVWGKSMAVRSVVGVARLPSPAGAGGRWLPDAEHLVTDALRTSFSLALTHEMGERVACTRIARPFHGREGNWSEMIVGRLPDALHLATIGGPFHGPTAGDPPTLLGTAPHSGHFASAAIPARS
jgi:hypothetical protein